MYESEYDISVVCDVRFGFCKVCEFWWNIEIYERKKVNFKQPRCIDKEKGLAIRRRWQKMMGR